MHSAVRGIRPVGERAVLVELPGNATVRQLVARLPGAIAGIEELVAGHETVLIVWERGRSGPPDLARRIERLLESGQAPVMHESIELPVVYDGPDLDAVAEHCGMSREEVVARHQAAQFEVGFIGFSPGFAYLVGGDPALRPPRRSEPRERVPAGSLAIAGEYSAIYPRESPGGWNLIGRALDEPFDLDREPQALLRTGMSVRFVAVDAARAVELGAAKQPHSERKSARSSDAAAAVELEAAKRSHSERKSARSSAAAAAAASSASVALERFGGIEVIDAGSRTTIQDLGRSGLSRLGVPPSGAIDRPALTLANRLVGNAEDAPALETTLLGPTLLLHDAQTIAITGAEVEATLGGRPVAMHAPIHAHAGSTLRIARARSGLRTYIAVRGGFDARRTLGSASSDQLTGLGPPPLKAGDRFGVGTDQLDAPAVDVAPVKTRERAPTVRVVVGPREDWFAPDAVTALLSEYFSVTPQVDRIGIRLRGPELILRSNDQLRSEGLVAGAIQVPPSGGPILLLADHPTTGGYPVIAVVLEDDLPLVAQLLPGQRLRFKRALLTLVRGPLRGRGASSTLPLWTSCSTSRLASWLG